MKGKKLQLTTIIIHVLFSMPLLGLTILVIPFFPLAAIIIHVIAIIILRKANRKTIGNFIGIIASFISLMTYTFFVINSFTSDSIVVPEWPSIFIVISWPLHITTAIVIFTHYNRDRKELERIKQAEIQKLRLQKEQEEFERQEKRYLDNLVLCRDALLEKHHQGFNISVDTNTLLYKFVFTIIRDLVEEHKVPLYISMVLFNEIDDKKGDPELGYQAREVIRFIEEQQKLEAETGTRLIHFMSGDIKQIIERNGLSFKSNDDKILAFTLLEQQKGNKKMLYVSNDRGTRIKAVPLGLEVFDFNEYVDSEYLQ